MECSGRSIKMNHLLIGFPAPLTLGEHLQPGAAGMLMSLCVKDRSVFVLMILYVSKHYFTFG